MPLKMKELPNSERPYEKLEMYGERALSNAELLAIIIKSGTKEESSVTLAQKILSLGNNCNEKGLNYLQELSIEELTKIKGIGKVKAIQLKAVCELANRINKPINNFQVVIKSPQDVAKLLVNELSSEKQEVVKVVLLNSKNIITKIQTIALGSTNCATVNPKDIFMEIIKTGAPKFVMVHNHPSGIAKPSMNDLEITERIENGAKILGIQFLDHIVIAGNEYISIKQYKLKQKAQEINSIKNKKGL